MFCMLATGYDSGFLQHHIHVAQSQLPSSSSYETECRYFVLCVGRLQVPSVVQDTTAHDQFRPNRGMPDRRALMSGPHVLNSLPRPEYEALGLEPWESSLQGRPTLPKKQAPSGGRAGANSSLPIDDTEPKSSQVGGTPDQAEFALDAPPGAEEERLHLVRLTDSLSRGVWPTYARLACALNLLALRAMHAQLCQSLAGLIWRRDYRARAPLAARVCGAVPFHPAGEGGQALGTEVAGRSEGTGGGAGQRDLANGKGVGGTAAVSSTFYSAFLHPLYVWAQCLDRQFYAQVWAVLCVCPFTLTSF